MTKPSDGSASRPFFAVAPADVVVRELEIEGTNQFMSGEDVFAVRDAFEKHGVVVFIDTLSAAEAMMSMMAQVLDMACETPWVNRTSQKETLQ